MRKHARLSGSDDASSMGAWNGEKRGNVHENGFGIVMEAVEVARVSDGHVESRRMLPVLLFLHRMAFVSMALICGFCDLTAIFNVTPCFVSVMNPARARTGTSP